MSEKANFYSRDPGAPDPSTVGEAKVKKPYNGVERRRTTRRVQADRRGDVRFELNKDDRRKNKGRRENDNTPDFW